MKTLFSIVVFMISLNTMAGAMTGIELNCERTNRVEKPTLFEDPTETRLLCKDLATNQEIAMLFRGLGIDMKLNGDSLEVTCSQAKSVDELIFYNHGYFGDAESLRSAEFIGTSERGNCKVKGATFEVSDESEGAALSFWKPTQLFE